MRTTFDWLTGVASIAAPCPSTLSGEDGLRPFYRHVNKDLWGPRLPRWLFHESLHYWQLVSSSYLQTVVADEWARVLAFERDGRPPPPSTVRASFARAAADEPFSVRDLVECLARLADVCTRGAHRLLQEEGDDLGGAAAAIEAERHRRGHDEQSQWEVDAILNGGRDRGLYGAPYVWMKERARASTRIRALGAGAEAWAVTLFLPVAGRLALNTPSPVRSFIAAFDRALSDDILVEAVARRSPDLSIQVDWLAQWADLERAMCEAVGLGAVPDGGSTVAVLGDHPVYRHLGDRVRAMEASIASFYWEYESGRISRGRLSWAQRLHLPYEVRLAVECPWAVPCLPGQASFLWLIGGVYAPPMTRFLDAEIPATRSAFPDLPWPSTEEALVAAVHDCEARFGALRRAEAALKFGLPQDAFAAAATAASR